MEEIKQPLGMLHFMFQDILGDGQTRLAILTRILTVYGRDLEECQNQIAAWDALVEYASRGWIAKSYDDMKKLEDARDDKNRATAYANSRFEDGRRYQAICEAQRLCKEWGIDHPGVNE